MSSPRVSVIIPTYNYGIYISEAIQSVLNQSFTDFELIVVDDGSTDHTAEVVRAFTDPRIKYIFQKNAGLPAARNAGIKGSFGELLAFLDADDRYHPEKLQSHVSFLDKHPEVGITYNSRILIDSSGKPLLLEKAPCAVTLSDLVCSYPLGPSDMVIRRELAFKIGLFDESFILNSEDLNFNLRLILEGYKFAGLAQPLNYRRIHSGRFFRNVPGKMDTFIRGLDTVFSDPRCPPNILGFRNIAYSNHYLSTGYQAFVQDDITLGQSYFREAVKLNPAILDNDASNLVEFLIYTSIRDGSNHEPVLRKIFFRLPQEIAWLSVRCDWAVSYGYLLRGIRNSVWQRGEPGSEYFSRANEFGLRLDEQLLRNLTDQLINYEMTFGATSCKTIIDHLSADLLRFGNRRSINWLYGCIEVNRAFRDYHEENYKKVIPEILRAISFNPTYLSNRGVFAIMAHSLIKELYRETLF